MGTFQRSVRVRAVRLPFLVYEKKYDNKYFSLLKKRVAKGVPDKKPQGGQQVQFYAHSGGDVEKRIYSDF